MNTQYLYKGATLLLSSFFLFLLNCSGQTDALLSTKAYEKPFHISLSVIQLVSQKDKTSGRVGPIQIKTYPTNGIEVGGRMIYNFGYRYAVSAGFYLGFSKTSYGFEANFNQLYSNPAIFGNLNEWGDEDYVLVPYFSFPFGGQYSISAGRRIQIPISYSANFKIIPNAEYRGNAGINTEKNQRYELASLFLDTRPNNWSIDHQFKTGITVALPNHKLVNINLVANISPKSNFKGYYMLLYDTNQITEGDYAHRMSYLGLELGYTFTGVKKRKEEKKQKY